MALLVVEDIKLIKTRKMKIIPLQILTMERAVLTSMKVINGSGTSTIYKKRMINEWKTIKYHVSRECLTKGYRRKSSGA